MRFALTLALAASLLPATALAQTSNETLVVTATRAPAVADRLPARIDIIDRRTIEARALLTLADAIGASAVQTGGPGAQTSLFLRGSNSKHALALYDGVRLNDAAAPNGQYDFGLDTLGALERIEVLRGPASAIYGSDAIGGVVNQIPRRGGEDAFSPFLEASAGSFQTLHALVGAAGESGGLSYGVSAERYQSDGFDVVPQRMTTHDGDEDGAEISTLAASLRQDFAATGIDLLARWRDATSEYDTFSGGPFFSQRADDPDLESQTTQSLWRLGADHALGAWTLRLEGGRIDSDRAEIDGGFETSGADFTRDFADATARYQTDAATLTFGAAFERAAIDTAPQFADPLSAEEDQTALYLIAQRKLSDRIDLTGSARLDDYESFGQHATYGLGINARFSDMRVFASYATAFKAPTLSELYEQSFFNVGNPDLDPEESQSFEIGADVSPTDALTIGASFYATRIDNLIEYNFGELRNINIGRAAIDGAELFAELAPTSWADLRVTYAWTDATNEDTGAQLARRPENSWTIEAEARPADALTLSLAWRFVGERTDVTYDDFGEFLSSAGTIASFQTASLAASYALNHQIEAFARIDNITDETYEQPAAFAGAPRGGLIGVRARY